MSEHNIIPASLAITSMRDSGYKTAAHALAELIDNSIQAEAKTVQLICFDKTNDTAKRRIKYVNQIAIFDNGKGMLPHTLQQALQFGGGAHRDDPNGIGKFGMGLPSATISQCRRLDIYSWKSGKCYYTYLDVNEIERGNLSAVPEPIEKSIPEKWLEAIGEDYNPDNGTLAIWSELDRVTWKTSKSIFTHSEKLIGRMYRHFIASKQIMVRFKSFSDDISLIKDRNELFKVNDPLFLYRGDTILPDLPGDYKNESFFEPFGENPEEIFVELNDGTKGTVTITYSRVVKTIHQAIARESSKNVGDTPYGKLAAENNGVSIVRSGRELKMTDIFTSTTDPRDRWYGVEVSFPPALDELFGVTFDKQDVVNFEVIDLKTEAENEGFDSEDIAQMAEFKEKFNKDRSNRYWINEITTAIKKNIASLRGHTTSLKEKVEKAKDEAKNTLTYAERIAKKVSDERIKEKRETDSERQFRNPEISPEKKEENLKVALIKDGVEQKEAEDIASTLIKNDCNVKFLEQPMRGNIFFDVTREAGTIIVHLNTNHEFYKFYNQFDEDKQELMKLVLIAWAQCEDDSNERTRNDMQDIRMNWGKMMSNYLYELNEQ
ncbi:ATP-binding protein [Photobacterium damselae]|uniref:ATP-binding protein n=1 Tax=Photobacterium damselae TaxID=38293 RepID=UPI0010FCE7AA|nr:ATP-binding protein [Photobacterium damselae]TLS74441.1 hypothetical protein FD721_18890 [Photobacterium damselae subsp. damselae]TLS86867.1 hypothetical protein FD720_09685 [Photobacterium damselae subsp. damselae]